MNNRFEILKKKLGKEEIAKSSLKNAEKKDKERDQEKVIEEAFLSEEQKVLEKEHADQMLTKRQVDKMMLAHPSQVNNETCVLLSNFAGTLFILISRQTLSKFNLSRFLNYIKF